MYLLGVGGISRIAAEMVRRYLPGYAISGYYDDDPAKLNREYDGIRVLGNFKDLVGLEGDICVFNCLGNIRFIAQRIRYSIALKEKGFSFPRLIHPSAVLADNARIGDGTIICPLAVVNSQARVGFNTIVFSHTTVEHDVKIADNCYLSPQSVLCGKVVVEDNCYIGPGAILGAGVRVGRNSIIGAGSVVLEDVPEGVFYAGHPAYYIKHNELWGDA